MRRLERYLGEVLPIRSDGSMRRLALGIVTAGAVGTAATLRAQATSPPGTLAFTHVTIVDVATGNRLRDQTVIIAGDRIRSVRRSSAATPPPNARVVDATGKYLIPGLWDMHAHVTWPFQFFALPLMVATGGTGARDMWGTFAGADSVRRQTAAGIRMAPRLVVAGNIVDGPPGSQRPMATADTPERGRVIVDSLARAGAAFIKVYGLLTPDVYSAIADQSRKRGIPFAGHIPFRVRAADASDAGQRSTEHLSGVLEGCSSDESTAMRLSLASSETEVRGEGLSVTWRADSAAYTHLIDTFDPKRCDALLARFARNGTAIVPTQALFRYWTVPDRVDSTDVRLRYVPASLRSAWPVLGSWRAPNSNAAAIGARYWALRQRVIKRASELGVLVLAGTDAGGNPYTVPGILLQTELRLFVEAGLTPLQALQTATLNPARFLGATDSLGTVTAGKLADLVLLDADPLQDIGNTERIRAVVLGGRYLDRQTIDQMLNEASKAAAAARE